MDRVYLEFNIVNMITVVLMVAVFYAVVGAGVSLLRQYLPNTPKQEQAA